MKFSNIELPSNRKFGLFFSFVFIALAAYFYNPKNLMWTYIFVASSLIFFVVTLVKEEYLLPLNKLWLRFGLLLGMIISPVVLGVIFFGVFTPIATIMRLSGRDELRIRFKKKPSHWNSRSGLLKPDSFKNQF